MNRSEPHAQRISRLIVDGDVLVDEHVKAGKPVTITYTYRTVAAEAGHMLFFEIEQPTRDLLVDFDYSDCGIAHVNVLDLIPSVRPTRVERTPAELPHTAVRVEVNGWTFPRSGVAFVWTLLQDRSGHRSDRSTNQLDHGRGHY